MAIQKVLIDEGCTACGLCADICPEVFEMDDEAEVKNGVNFADYEEGIKEAAESCPVEVIQYK